MTENIFARASRDKLRFASSVGQLSVEDLWDMPIESLDAIFKSLNAKAKESQEESLLETRTDEERTIDRQIEIVKYVVQYKIDAIERREKATERRKRKARLMEILEEKQDEAIKDASPAKIKKMIADLED